MKLKKRTKSIIKKSIKRKFNFFVCREIFFVEARLLLSITFVGHFNFKIEKRNPIFIDDSSRKQLFNYFFSELFPLFFVIQPSKQFWFVKTVCNQNCFCWKVWRLVVMVGKTWLFLQTVVSFWQMVILTFFYSELGNYWNT